MYLVTLKINRDFVIIFLIQNFEADFMESQPQNPEFRYNLEKFHTCDSQNIDTTHMILIAVSNSAFLCSDLHKLFILTFTSALNTIGVISP